MSKLRAGIIGCGNISRMHAANYRSSISCMLVAAADLSAEAREAFSVEHPEAKMYASAREMLAEEQLAIVSICTPPRFHLEPALEAAGASIQGMILEKPMALNLQDADRVLKACESSGKVLAIGHQLRCAALYSTARELISQGRVGTVERIWGVCHGAPLQTNATHTIDLMNYLLSDEPVAWVLGALDVCDAPLVEGIPQERSAVGMFQYREGARAVIESGDLLPGRGYHRIFVDGSDGQIELSRPGGPPIRWRAAATGGQWADPEWVPKQNPVDDLAAAIQEGRLPRASGSAGRAVLEIILALAQSALTRQRVELPLTVSGSPFDHLFA